MGSRRIAARRSASAWRGGRQARRCWPLARNATLGLAGLGLLTAIAMLYHARSALTGGDRALAAPPDALGYFSYLPALLVDGTWDVGDSFRRVLWYRPDLGAGLAGVRTPTGLTFDKYPVGSAVLWAPFFLAAHAATIVAAAAGLPVVPDGTGPGYQVAAAVGSVTYGTFGFVVSHRAAGRITSATAAGIAAVGVWLAGNAAYYMTMEPIMAHAPAMGLVALIVYLWRTGAYRWASWAGIGLAGGLLFAVRKPDALVLIGPLLWAARDAWVDRARARTILRCVGGFAAAAVFGGLPQILAQHRLYGSIFVEGYAFVASDYFDWTRPRLAFVLFSLHRGLFVWHPVYLLGLAGLVLVWRRDRRVASAGLLFFLVLWLLTAAWSSPDQGHAFGGRFFVALTPFLTIGVAAWLDCPRRVRNAALVALVAVAVWNGLFVPQYALERIPHDAPLTFDQLFVDKLRMLGLA